MPQIAKRIEEISESQTIAVDSKAKELKAKGIKVYNFAAGEPDIAPPDILLRGIAKAYHQGKTKYTHVAGAPEVRGKIAQYIKKLDGLSYSADEVVVSNGGKQALYSVFMSILNPGDEVIIVKPYWVSYSEQVILAGGKPVFVNTDLNLQPDIKTITEKISKKTKAVIINSPCNPTGVTFDKKKIKELARILENKNIFIVSDDIYQTLVYDGEFYQIAKYSKKIKEKTIIINGLSKSHSMTGLRFGFVVCNLKLAKAITKLQSQISSNTNTLMQFAAIDVMEKSKEYEEKYLKLFKKRRDLVLDLLSQNKLISFVKPSGAFYVFIDIRKLTKDSTKFATKLLLKEKVATVPGVAFGQEGYLRISFASSEKDLREGLEKFNQFCEKY